LTDENAETGKTAIDITTIAPRITTIKTDNAQNKIGIAKSAVYIDVPNSKNHLPLGEEETIGVLYVINSETSERQIIGEATISSVTAATVTYVVDWDIGAYDEGTYDVAFKITDVDGTSVEKTGQIIIDRSVPQKIINVTAIGDINGITLSWSISSEVDTTRYRIYRKSEIDADFYVLTNINNRNTLTFRDATVQSDRLYSYYVVGVNDFGQAGPPSDITIAAKGLDEESPVVTKFTPANASFINAITSVTVTAQDNVAVTLVKLYYSMDNGSTWNEIGSKTSSPFTIAWDTTQLSDGAVRVKAVAYDARNNESDSLVYVYSIDNTGPEKVTGLAYTSTSVTVTLSWNDVADNDIHAADPIHD